jgi:hypothetical protein
MEIERVSVTIKGEGLKKGKRMKGGGREKHCGN